MLASWGLSRSCGASPGYDWNAPPAEYIEQKVSTRIRGGDVVLLHDGGHKGFGADRSNTVKAVDALITRYKAEGYEFVTIPEMQKLGQPSATALHNPKINGNATLTSFLEDLREQSCSSHPRRRLGYS